MNQDVFRMMQAEVGALRASHQGRFDHAAFEASQAELRAAFDAQARKIRGTGREP